MSCSQRKADVKNSELVVFAAASMTETMGQIAGLYKINAPDVKLTFNFDSSGTLKTQIQEGAECDVFISAGQRQMDQLDSAAVNAEGLDFVLRGSRIDLLENRVALCVPEGNPAGIKNFADLADKLAQDNILFAMGNSDVPVGQYTQRMLRFFNLDEAALAKSGKITYGSNVKEVTTQIAASGADCGVVYCTDAWSAGLEIADYATVEMCGQVIYPAAVIKSGKNPDAAAAFLEYLKTDEALAVFENAGFAAIRR
jgi:molybdate transport system substrate-binding protein